jgi:hypothetical protein
LRVTLCFGVVLALSVGSGCLLANWFVHGGPLPVDHTITTYVVDQRRIALTAALRTVTAFGGTPVLAPFVVIVVVALITSRRRYLAVYLVVATVGAAVLSAATKPIVGRARLQVSFTWSASAMLATPPGTRPRSPRPRLHSS